MNPILNIVSDEGTVTIDSKFSSNFSSFLESLDISFRTKNPQSTDVGSVRRRTLPNAIVFEFNLFDDDLENLVRQFLDTIVQSNPDM